MDSAVFLEFIPGRNQYLLTIMSIWWAAGNLLASLVSSQDRDLVSFPSILTRVPVSMALDRELLLSRDNKPGSLPSVSEQRVEIRHVLARWTHVSSLGGSILRVQTA